MYRYVFLHIMQVQKNDIKLLDENENEFYWVEEYIYLGVRISGDNKEQDKEIHRRIILQTTDISIFRSPVKIKIKIVLIIGYCTYIICKLITRLVGIVVKSDT